MNVWTFEHLNVWRTSERCEVPKSQITQVPNSQSPQFPQSPNPQTPKSSNPWTRKPLNPKNQTLPDPTKPYQTTPPTPEPTRPLLGWPLTCSFAPFGGGSAPPQIDPRGMILGQFLMLSPNLLLPGPISLPKPSKSTISDFSKILQKTVKNRNIQKNNIKNTQFLVIFILKMNKSITI